MVFSPAISALQSNLGAGNALNAAQVKVREEEGVDADKSLETWQYITSENPTLVNLEKISVRFIMHLYKNIQMKMSKNALEAEMHLYSL